MLTLSCLCGAVRIEADKRPDFVNECNCTLCSKSGARWAYYDPAEVRVAGGTEGYRRTDKESPGAEIRFCARCGVTTHFVPTPEAVARFGNGMMGVNMALADEAGLAGIEWRYPDGRAWSGEGAFGYVRPARIVGREADR